MAEIHAYIDTNALLEFSPPDQIDWPGLVKAEHVRIVVAPVVLTELQRHKDGRSTVPARKRARAGERLKFIERGLSEASDKLRSCCRLRDGATLALDVEAVPERLFDEHQLDRHLADDRLVAHVLRAKELGRDVCLISNDSGARLVARSRGVRALDMPEGQRLRATDEPAAKPATIATEERTPRLELLVSKDEKSVVSVRRRGMLRPEDMDRELGRIREGLLHTYRAHADYFEANPQFLRATRGNGWLWSESDYRLQVEHYLQVLRDEGHLQARFAETNLRSLCVRLPLRLRNRGTRAAEGVVLRLDIDEDVKARFLRPDGVPDVDWQSLPPSPSPIGTALGWESAANEDSAFNGTVLSHLETLVRNTTKTRSAKWSVAKRWAITTFPYVPHDPKNGDMFVKPPPLILAFESFAEFRSCAIRYRLYERATRDPEMHAFGLVVTSLDVAAELVLPPELSTSEE